MAKSKVLTAPNVDKDVEHLEFIPSWWDCKTGLVGLENRLAVPYKKELLLPYDPVATLFQNYSNELKSYVHTKATRRCFWQLYL